MLKKKEDGPFWPHLTKLKQRYHWLKVNFNKWKEEDDSDLEVEQEDNFEEVSRAEDPFFPPPNCGAICIRLICIFDFPR